MKLTFNSTARRRTLFASSRSGGSPQIPLPVIRMAPNPRRLTVRSPPTSRVPAASAVICELVIGFLLPFSRGSCPSGGCSHRKGSRATALPHQRPRQNRLRWQRSRSGDQDDFSVCVPVLELGISVAHLVQGKRRGDRDLDLS